MFALNPSSSGWAFAAQSLCRMIRQTPQKIAVLQISSSLDWRSIKAGGKQVQFVSQPYTSDIDHTGALSEAIVTLPEAVAPKGTVDLEIAYEGVIVLDATRLTRIGTPEATANSTDWDQISTKFTAVRGAGYRGLVSDSHRGRGSFGRQKSVRGLEPVEGARGHFENAHTVDVSTRRRRSPPELRGERGIVRCDAEVMARAQMSLRRLHIPVRWDWLCRHLQWQTMKWWTGRRSAVHFLPGHDVPAVPTRTLRTKVTRLSPSGSERRDTRRRRPTLAIQMQLRLRAVHYC